MVKKIKEAEKPKGPLVVNEEVKQVQKIEEVEKLFVNLKITESKNKIQLLKQFLIKNDFDFEVLDQGRK